MSDLKDRCTRLVRSGISPSKDLCDVILDCWRRSLRSFLSFLACSTLAQNEGPFSMFSSSAAGSFLFPKIDLRLRTGSGDVGAEITVEVMEYLSWPGVAALLAHEEESSGKSSRLAARLARRFHHRGVSSSSLYSSRMNRQQGSMGFAKQDVMVGWGLLTIDLALSLSVK
jgi:hypothetical protein